ncbi:dihydrolipoyl dehydrogenase family protein [Roseivivax isoporae]|uniref:Pyridine nucleotide-disulfide oxidoreductase n=1 Tax=Roseivivax isoporae LMG 25204 TaxID=1449351 RepID=X7F7Y9_9RHOB|nr:NAD(P)/FAD-dependent oxidoreductase [Roseivivax isoporae]ETX29002.1 pyridine nucleotide-disulfide oxidoreductase [Roseivivax isoporae LMG 25204]
MARQMDLAVIGSGVVARSVATAMAGDGWSVAVIDRKPPAGTCVLRGCDPKKVLRDAAAVVDRAARMQGKGLAGTPVVHWPDLMAFKRGFTDNVPAQQEGMYRDAGIEVMHGTARFTGPNELDVDGETVTARHVVLGVGARPRPMDVPGAECLIDHEAFMELPALPGRIVFVGGGYIAAEFASLAARAGAEVTVLQRGDRLLAPFDPDMVAHVSGALPPGLTVATGAEVTSIERQGGVFVVRHRIDGRQAEVEADCVVHAAGRVPDLDALDLAAGAVDTEGGRLVLDDRLRSVSNETVLAGGDAAQVGPPLTPVASHDADVIVANLRGEARCPDYGAVPSVAFTIPPIASVGLHEADAGDDVEVRGADATDWFSARHVAAPVLAYKTLSDAATGRILGAHLVGPHADEMINLFAVAIRAGMTVSELRDVMFAYPTSGSDIPSML